MGSSKTCELRVSLFSTLIEGAPFIGVTFISNDQAPEVLQPGEQPLDFPPSSVSLQPTSILSRIPSVSTMWGNDFNAVESHLCVEAVGVVGVISDQVLWSVGNNHLYQGRHC